MADNVYGRVFDSSLAGWIADLIISGQIADYEASIGALWDYEAIQDASIHNFSGVSLIYVDGSLAERDASIAWCAANSGISYAYLDGSLAERDASIAWLNVYVEDLSSLVHTQDPSILDLYNESSQKADKTYVDGSLAERDTSILWLQNNKLESDYLFPYATNASVGLALNNYTSISYVDGSLNVKVNQSLFDTSISALTVVNNNQDASISLMNNWNISQDASIILKLNSADASTTYAQRLTSFAIKDVSYLATASDNNNVIFADTSAMYVIFPNSLPVGFQTTVINRTTGNITLNASTYYATDSSIVLRDRYAAASIVCSSTGVFYFMGNLK